MKLLKTKDKLANGVLKTVGGLLAVRTFSRLRQQSNTKTEPPENREIISQPDQPAQVPTVYVHGFRGGDYTTNKMVLSAQETIHSNTYLKVLVDWRGQLSYQGSWSDDPNPLIQIVFEDKWMPTLQIVNWLTVVLPQLQQKYHFSKYNAVGHSIGATALVRTEMRNYSKPDFPKLEKLVLVAGPFDGVVAFGDWPNVNHLNQRGRPVMMNPHYIQLLANRHHFPSNVSVLNIYGNVDDTSNTDKYISVISAKSIRYILAPIVNAFHEVEIHGKNAEHSKMHDDPQVLSLINQFLFASGQ
ncbi:alpha/beta hydrolase [Lapidilactobacillus mulanensis]|uniref:Alpha/beta hydrolase n=1 Tax=Lapidilactobacillus mulanensis TaxID=2485999 RepID=A0ABW4DMZ0_9LACO|nr:alpha/beta hydrolase [Lapidilactobacillus mulanensis]